MCHLFRIAIFSALAVCAWTSPVTAQRHAIGAAIVNGGSQYSLVTGEVVDVREIKGGGFRATVEIVRVYTGPKSLKGLAFFDNTADAGFAGNSAIPLLEVGEKGIWILSVDKNSDTWFVSGRYRKDYVPEYDWRVEWAEAIEELCKLDVTKRLKLAQELCGRRTPEVAKLGVEVLLGAKPDDAKAAGVPEFLKGLPTDRKVTPSALVRADRLWFERDGKEWLDSDRRKALLTRFTEPLTEDDAVEVVSHVIQTRYMQSSRGVWFTAQEGVTLLGKIATDPRQPRTVRRVVVEKVVKTASNAGVRVDFTFEILLTVVRQGVEDGVRLQAAEGCVKLVKGISGSQLDTVYELLKDERNADVAKALKDVIDKSK